MSAKLLTVPEVETPRKTHLDAEAAPFPRGPVPRFRPKDGAKLEAELRRRVEGEVRFDDGSRAMYSVDASNYRQVPIGVVIPKSVADAMATIAACREYGAPVLSRGGGTSLAGQCCNVAIVIDWTKYLGHVLEVDPVRRIGRVEPGCVVDKLRNAAGRFGMTFGPDPATHSHCTLGGMLGNNSCGVHAQMAGSVASNTEEMEIVTYDGTRMTAGWMTDAQMVEQIARGGRQGEILAGIRALRQRYERQIRKRFPDIPRRISGYNLDQLLPDKDGRFNLARALVGSEGTLVTILEATLRLVHNPPFQALVVLGYPDVYHAGDHVPEVLESKPMGLEGIDEGLINNVKRKGTHAKYLDHLPPGKGWLMVQLPGDTKEESDGRARELMARLAKKANAPTMRLYDDAENERAIWAIRESGLGATAFVPGSPPSWPGWEDAAVPPARLGRYLRDFCSLLQKHGLQAALYGHFGMGCVHCRITFDLFSKTGVRNYRRFAEDAAELVVRYGGSLSGEHGDGQSRAELLPRMFGKEIVQAFREFKAIWDPDWKMNPGKVVDPNRLDENLRLGASYKPWEPKTHFQYPNDHGKLSEAALRCVGVGKCRRESSDVVEDQTICPSYMVTKEEKHSTRGRAHLLWEMMQGETIRDRWRDEHVKEALDLCLSCKGCKGDCPVNVDMATYKAEFLSHYWAGRIRPRAAYAFGLVDKWARIGAKWPGFVNLATSAPGASELAKFISGMAPQRKIPQFAPECFTDWYRRRGRGTHSATRTRVVLFPDTFNNYFFPQTARAAVEVLEHLGYEVQVPKQQICCGRPLYDYGFLGQAKQYLLRVIDLLRPAVASGTPIIVLEPSCWSVLRDEIHEMLPDNGDASRLMENTFLLGEFLERQGLDGMMPKLNASVLVHGHCHHKAIIKRAEHELKVLRHMGVDVEEVTSGCCGMAGSFGFEEDKYDVSVKVGEQKLLPAVRRAGLKTIVMADGFSCREQISQLTERRALHLAEVMKLAIESGPSGSGGLRPENLILAPQDHAVEKSKRDAAIAISAALAVIGGATALFTSRRS